MGGFQKANQILSCNVEPLVDWPTTKKRLIKDGKKYGFSLVIQKSDVDRSPQRHLIGEDPYGDNRKRKSIFFALLLKLNFGVPGRLTTCHYMKKSR